MVNGVWAQEALKRWEEKRDAKSELLASRPQLGYYEQIVWEAFQVLHSAREYNMGGPQKLRISEALIYMKEIGLKTDDGLILVLAMDDTWMEYYVKKHGPKKGK